MINFQELEKVAEFKNGELNWIEGRDINAVYVILVGDEYYIGSSHYTYLRINQHLDKLLKGEHHSEKFQKKFDVIKEFDVYSLERGIRKENLQIVEYKYIQKYNPSLNIASTNNRKGINQLIKIRIKDSGWTLERLALEMKNKNGEKGISQAAVSQIINGNPTFDKLQEIASIIGISVSELVMDEEELNKNFITCPKCGSKFELKE